MLDLIVQAAPQPVDEWTRIHVASGENMETSKVVQQTTIGWEFVDGIMAESYNVADEETSAELANEKVEYADGVCGEQPELEEDPQPVDRYSNLLYRRVLTMTAVEVSVRCRDEQNALQSPRHSQERYDEGEVNVLIGEKVQEWCFEYQFVFLEIIGYKGHKGSEIDISIMVNDIGSGVMGVVLLLPPVSGKALHNVAEK